jgi:hypothetical protein
MFISMIVIWWSMVLLLPFVWSFAVIYHLGVYMKIARSVSYEYDYWLCSFSKFVPVIVFFFPWFLYL